MKEGWKESVLNEVCEVITDGTHQTPTYFDEGIVFLSSKNVTTGKIDWDNVRYIDEAQHVQMQKRVSPQLNDLLLAKNGTTGVAALVDREIDFDIYVSLALIRPKDEILPTYLLKFVNSPLAKEQFNARLKGIGVPNLHLKEIREVKMPIPPLPEQERIVAKLDAAFAAIDQAKANVEQNLQNAKELFQSKLNEVFSQKRDGWVEKKLSEITSKIGSGATPRGGQNSYKKEGISLIRSLNVYDDGFREKDLAYIDDEQATKLDNVTLQENDVLLNITGASVARCCVVPKEYLPARVNQHVSIIRVNQGTIEPDFLHYQLISKPCKDELLGIGEQGATRQAITKAQIENYTVRYPQDSDDQLNVVAELERFKETTKQLQTHYTQKLMELEELKKSLLERAFKGEI